MKRIKLNLQLPAQASEVAIKNVMKAKGLKPYRGNLDWVDDVDVKGIVDRAQAHQIFERGISRTVSVKLDTLEVDVDDESQVIAYLYEES